MNSMLASIAIVLTFYANPAASAEFPKTGEAEYDTFYVDNPIAKIDSGAGTGAIVDVTGITRNIKGEGPFIICRFAAWDSRAWWERLFTSTAAALKPTKTVTTYHHVR
jgi:hypothetical protein